MTTNGEGPTRPGTPATITRLALVERKQQATDTKVDSIDQAVTLLLASQQETEERLGAKVDLLRGDMRKGFDRLGDLIDRVNDRHERDYRRTEDSVHDLEERNNQTRRLIMLKNVSWPTAIVAAAIFVCCTVLIAMGKPVPTWLVGLVGSGGIGGAILPGLLGSKQS